MGNASVPGLPDGRYEIESVLGQGAMGRVWKAWDTALRREVAIKEMTPPAHLTAEDRAVMGARFLREAQAIARIDHPGVVRVYDVIKSDDTPLIVMEYVAGPNLQQVLREGPLPPAATLEIATAVLGALRAAHRRDVLHRDVKPGNILTREDGRVVLTDFGLAKVVDNADLSHSGQVTGTPAYIAPERLNNQPASPAADLWSLGVTLYACLYGKSPFVRAEGDLPTLMAVVNDPVPSRDHGVFGPLLEGLLRKDPHRRIDGAEAERLLAQVRRSLTGAPVPIPQREPDTVVLNPQRSFAPVRPEGPAPGPSDAHPGVRYAPRPRRRGRKVLTALIVLLLAAGAAGAYLRWGDRLSIQWAATPSDTPSPQSSPPDQHLVALQDFAGTKDLDTCTRIGSLQNQLTRRSCREGDVEVTWILYGSPQLRDDQREADIRLSAGCEAAGCGAREGAGPDGEQGNRVVYRYTAADDGNQWIALWWDDDVSSPQGSAALNLRTRFDPADPADPDPAASLHAIWESWGYRLTD